MIKNRVLKVREGIQKLEKKLSVPKSHSIPSLSNLAKKNYLNMID